MPLSNLPQLHQNFLNPRYRVEWTAVQESCSRRGLRPGPVINTIIVVVLVDDWCTFIHDKKSFHAAKIQQFGQLLITEALPLVPKSLDIDLTRFILDFKTGTFDPTFRSPKPGLNTKIKTVGLVGTSNVRPRLRGITGRDASK